IFHDFIYLFVFYCFIMSACGDTGMGEIYNGFVPEQRPDLCPHRPFSNTIGYLVSLFVFDRCYFFHFSLRLLLTTLTLLRAMAAPAIIGLSRKPLIGYNTPAAIGMPIRL